MKAAFLFPVLVLSSHLADDSIKLLNCKRDYQFKHVRNQESELDFCLEHSGMTCCGPDDTYQIKG
jgi:hypothetical protein